MIIDAFRRVCLTVLHIRRDRADAPPAFLPPPHFSCFPPLAPPPLLLIDYFQSNHPSFALVAPAAKRILESFLPVVPGALA